MAFSAPRQNLRARACSSHDDRIVRRRFASTLRDRKLAGGPIDVFATHASNPNMPERRRDRRADRCTKRRVRCALGPISQCGTIYGLGSWRQNC
jgi:hypothetical protein